MPNSDLIEAVTRLSGALSLLAAYKIGCGGGWTRARARLQRPRLTGPAYPAPASGRGTTAGRESRHGAKCSRAWLRFGAALLAAASLCSILAYVEVRVEAGWAEPEAMGFEVVKE